MDCKLVSVADKKKNHCGSCTACIDVCPTDAFVGPYQLNASRCVSYLTIEHKGIIPEDLRPLIGNRVYGCDDCQLVCPWNKFAKVSQVPDFDVRNGLSNSTLLELFDWSEKDFYDRHRGSSILRIGYPRWLRNLAIALGNSSPYFNQDENTETGRAREKRAVMLSLSCKVQKGCDLVAPHALWALQRLESKD
jgi:epoxyqueuosine reductase